MEKRILIKLSGEGLSNKEKNLAIDYDLIEIFATQIKQLLAKNYQIGVVVGGGNFWRGASAEKNGISRNRADYIGMLATIMNALALQSGFENAGIITRVQSSLMLSPKVAENYVNEKSIDYLNKGVLVIFAGGTGRPYFTTDTGATLFASEIGAKLILMGKNGVDGIYDSDPKINKDAVRFEKLTYDQILSKNLHVMDLAAVAMARDNDLKIIVFDITKKNSLINAIEGKSLTTKVSK